MVESCFDLTEKKARILLGTPIGGTMRSKEERFHHQERIKNNRMKYEICKNLTDKGKKKFMTTPVPCSCHMCGNPRTIWNEDTIQEKRFPKIEDFYDEI